MLRTLSLLVALAASICAANAADILRVYEVEVDKADFEKFSADSSSVPKSLQELLTAWNQSKQNTNGPTIINGSVIVHSIAELKPMGQGSSQDGQFYWLDETFPVTYPEGYLNDQPLIWNSSNVGVQASAFLDKNDLLTLSYRSNAIDQWLLYAQSTGARQPLFHTSEINTELTIAPDSIVVVGGKTKADAQILIFVERTSKGHSIPKARPYSQSPKHDQFRLYFYQMPSDDMTSDVAAVRANGKLLDVAIFETSNGKSYHYDSTRTHSYAYHHGRGHNPWRFAKVDIGLTAQLLCGADDTVFLAMQNSELGEWTYPDSPSSPNPITRSSGFQAKLELASGFKRLNGSIVMTDKNGETIGESVVCLLERIPAQESGDGVFD